MACKSICIGNQPGQLNIPPVSRIRKKTHKNDDSTGMFGLHLFGGVGLGGAISIPPGGRSGFFGEGQEEGEPIRDNQCQSVSY